MDPEVLAHYTLGIEEPRLTEGGSITVQEDP
jgi:hypothetical protein